MIKQTIISILFIVIVHKLYLFFISQFTTPKVNDFVNKPKEEYMKILEAGGNASNHENNKGVQNNDGENVTGGGDPAMKATLKNFLKGIAEQPSFSNSTTGVDSTGFSSYTGGDSIGSSLAAPSPF